MAATLAERLGVRLKQGGRPAVRPTDPMVAGFESTMEALVAVTDDREAIAHTIRGLQQQHAQSARLLRHLHDRIQRLDGVVLPDLHGTLVDLDARLTDRTAQRRNGSNA